MKLVELNLCFCRYVQSKLRTFSCHFFQFLDNFQGIATEFLRSFQFDHNHDCFSYFQLMFLFQFWINISICSFLYCKDNYRDILILFLIFGVYIRVPFFKFYKILKINHLKFFFHFYRIHVIFQILLILFYHFLKIVYNLLIHYFLRCT